MTDPTAESEPATTSYVVPPVARAFALLRYIAAGNRCRNKNRAAKELGINRTTLMRLLGTLQDDRIIEALPEEGGFRLGTGLITLASSALHDRNIIQVARPYLLDLVQTLKLSAHLGIREGHEIVYLARETPNSHLASNVREGTRLPAHATTIGRILLANMPENELYQLYKDFDLQAFSTKTKTTVDDLAAQLREDRKNGIAWSIANLEPEIGSAAMAVRDHRGEVVGAINVTGHVSIFEPGSPHLAEIAAELKAATDGTSQALGYLPQRL